MPWQTYANQAMELFSATNGGFVATKGSEKQPVGNSGFPVNSELAVTDN
jgi:hypothetical protein